MKIQNVILWRRFFSGMAYTAMQSVFFIYLQLYKGFETAQIATAFSVLVFVSQALSLFAGAWGDRFGRMRIMLLGCLFDAAGYLVLLMTHSYPMLIVATFCFGFGSTLFGTNARAYMISNSAADYASKTRAQGKFLKIASLASMIAPLMALPFIHFRKAEWLIWVSAGIELAMLLFVFFAIQKCNCTAPKEVAPPFRFSQMKQVLSKRFVAAHLLLFIPLAMGTSFYVIFPYLFTSLLSAQELVPVAFFVNNLIAVLLQSKFSRKINFGISKLIFITPILLTLVFVPWFMTLQHLNNPIAWWALLILAFGYLILFALLTLFTSTAMANVLVRLDKGENQGLMFGTSKLILSLTTAAVMNILPTMFLI